MNLLQTLKKIEDEHKAASEKMASEHILSDKKQYQKLAKRFSFLDALFKDIVVYKELLRQKKDLDAILKAGKESKEFLALAAEEIIQIDTAIEKKQEDIEEKLYEEKSDPDRTVIIEMRPAAGGQESSLFAADLFRLYSKYVAKHNWQLEMLDSNPTGIGGFKEVVFAVKGKGAYAHLKFESGVHRVQRVPETESSGRIHTSTLTVAVLKEPSQLEVQVDPKDLKIDTYRSSGAGGQHVNTTDSAVRITHLPSGIIAACQDERSQIKNRAKAMRILKARLLEYEQSKQDNNISSERRKQVGSGDRSEKIRTYNFPQRRVTDHRGPITVYRLEEILEGDLDLIIKQLILQARKARI